MDSATPRMDWTKLLDASRYGFENQGGDVRSPFQRDIDRITFSDAFRRLARKTQVHPLNENDHIHTRLTHSLEVASVGKSLGELIGLFLEERGELPGAVQPRDVGEAVQAACLAHDIGNPPFGHSGEEAIKDWFAAHPEVLDGMAPECRTDFTRFDGNAMAVRILLSTGFYQQGMSPTHAVIGTLLKYPWPSDSDIKKGKFSCFRTEADALQKIADRLGLLDMGGRFARHPLAYLAEAADDICYRIIDIEDATEVGILPELFMYDSFADALDLKGTEWRREWYPSIHFRQRNSIIRAKLINLATNEMVEMFKTHFDTIMTGALAPADSLMNLSDGIGKTLHTVYKGIEDRLFLSRRKAILELGAQNALGILLDQAMGRANTQPSGFSLPSRVKTLLGRDIIDAIPQDENHAYHLTMAVLDYVSGMTDHYATTLCRKLLGLGY